MKAYSLDLREKVVRRYEAGGITQRQLAGQFGVSLFFVVKILRLKRSGEPLTPKKVGGKCRPKLNEEMRSFVEAELDRENDLSLEELCERVAERFAIGVSRTTMCRAVAAMNLRRKKRVFTQQSGKPNG